LYGYCFNWCIPIKYMTNIGQNTGMSNTSKKVHVNAMSVDFIVDNLINFLKY